MGLIPVTESEVKTLRSSAKQSERGRQVNALLNYHIKIDDVSQP